MNDSFVATRAQRDTNLKDTERPGTGTQPTESQRVQETRSDSASAKANTPPVDVLEDSSGITLLADMPGVSKESLEIKVEGDTLTLEGAITSATPQALEASYAEVRVPRFRRSFTLSRELGTAAIEAQLKDGVLKLRLPKHEKAQPRRINVKVV